MNSFRLTILIVFLNVSVFGQSQFSKDVLINRTIFKCLDSLQKLNLLPKSENIFLWDHTLTNPVAFVGYAAPDYTKDTTTNNVVLISSTHPPLSFWRKSQKFLYSLEFTIMSVEDQEIKVYYQLHKIFKKRGVFSEINVGPEIHYTFRVNDKLSDHLDKK